MKVEEVRPGVSTGQLVKLDKGSYSYLNQILEEFNSTHDFLVSFAFGKRIVEKEFQMILDRYFNKSLQEFYDYLVNEGQVVCEVSGCGHIKDMTLSTTVSRDEIEIDDGQVTNGEELFEIGVITAFRYSPDVAEVGYFELDDVEVGNEQIQLPETVKDTELKDIIYGQETI